MDKINNINKLSLKLFNSSINAIDVNPYTGQSGPTKNPLLVLVLVTTNAQNSSTHQPRHEYIIKVIAKGKKGEEIKILDDSYFKYPPSKVFINYSKENLDQVTKVNLTEEGENEIGIIWDYPIHDCENMFCDIN